MAMMPQAVLQVDNFNQDSDDAVLLKDEQYHTRTAHQRAVYNLSRHGSHNCSMMSSIIQASGMMPLYKSTWKSQLLNAGQYNLSRVAHQRAV
jgi:hypothetical protein